MLTGQATIPTAVAATRLGAFDYIEKMQDRERTLVVIKNAIESGRLKKQNRRFITQIREKYKIVGESAPILALQSQIEKVGPTSSTVLVTGESGTGKELVARQIHFCSDRQEREFVPVDAGTLADDLAESELFGHRRGAFTGAVNERRGLFAEAEGGTLFLDEITNASLSLQARLLHVLQEIEYRRLGENQLRKCDVRVIAASNRDLMDMVQNGKFREDLFYRLRVIELSVPPLRERKEDIPILVNYFLSIKTLQCSSKLKRITPSAVNLLFDHDWPGNVRELENLIERVVVLSDTVELGPADVEPLLPFRSGYQTTELKSLAQMTRDFKRDCVIRALNLTNGKVSRAAAILDIDRTHLYRLIEEYNLKDSL
jgi:two-component system nitrogen regulation response regulator NtrX